MLFLTILEKYLEKPGRVPPQHPDPWSGGTAPSPSRAAVPIGKTQGGDFDSRFVPESPPGKKGDPTRTQVSSVTTLGVLRFRDVHQWGSQSGKWNQGCRAFGPRRRTPPPPLPPGRGPHWRVWSSPSSLLGVCCPPGPRLADVCCGAAAGPRRLSGGRGDGLSRQLRSEPGLGVRPLLALHARERRAGLLPG